jgi:hypothetical protein
MIEKPQPIILGQDVSEKSCKKGPGIDLRGEGLRSQMS